MKVIIFAARPDEQEALQQLDMPCEVTTCGEAFSSQTAHLVKGHDSFIIIGNCRADRSALEIANNLGINYFSTRSAGFNNIDLKAVKDLGMRVACVPAYSPNSVAEFTVLSALAMIRNYPLMLEKGARQDYSLKGLLGKEIRNMSLGFIGTGKIGKQTIESFLGFKPQKIYAYANHPNPELHEVVEYVSMAELFKESDLISLHASLSPKSYHLINKQAIDQMKDGVYLINTSRGGLMDAEAVLQGLESGKIAGLATDVYEHEVGILHANNEGKKYVDPVFQALHDHPRVIVSPHCAFYTDEAVSNMIEYSLQNVCNYAQHGYCDNEIKSP